MVLDPDASSAKTLVLVAIILQAVFFLIGIFVAIFVVSFFVAFTPPVGYGGAPFDFAFGFVPFIFSIAFSIGIIWILLDYLLIYKPLGEGRVAAAESPCLVLSIIQLVIGGVIAGILLIIAWTKIKDSLRRSTAPASVSSSTQQPMK